MSSRDDNSAQQDRDRLRAMLAERSTDSPPLSSSKKLVVSDSGAGTPLFCIHGGAAGLASYRRIVDCHDLGRPVFGLQTVTKSVDDPTIAGIESLAQVHLDLILEQAPKGPLMLAGHSMAAIVALELGQRLLEAGRDVRLLTIIDHPGPDVSLTTRDWLYWQWIAMSALPWTQRGRFIWDGIRYRIRSNQRIPRWIRRFFTNGTKTNNQANRPNSPAEYRLRISETSLHALKKYKPQPFARPMVLFGARSGAPRLHADPQGGWSRISGGNIQVVEIPGHHMNIFQPPHVNTFAEKLAEILAKYDCVGPSF